MNPYNGYIGRPFLLGRPAKCFCDHGTIMTIPCSKVKQTINMVVGNLGETNQAVASISMAIMAMWPWQWRKSPKKKADFLRDLVRLPSGYD